MAPRNQAWKLLVGLGIGGLALAGCSGLSGSSATTDSDGATVDPWAFLETSTEDSDAEADREPLTADRIGMLAGKPGDVGAAPKRIDLFLSQTVFPSDAVGKDLDEATVVTIEPPLDVDIKVAARDRLKITPVDGFAPETEYTVRIDKLGTQDGVLTPPKKSAWQASFATPSLSLLRVVPVKVDTRRRRANLHLVFSGPVDVNSLRGKVAITDESGRSIAIGGLSPTSDDNRVRVSLSGPDLRAKNTFKIDVESGFSLQASVRANVKGKGGSDTWAFDPNRPDIDIEAVHMVEGTSSFSVEVICDDDASEGYKRWTWLRHVGDSFRVSPRCLPTDDSASEFIKVNPEVPFSVVPTRGGFRLVGDFPQGSLQVEIGAGMVSVDGGLLDEGLSKDLVVPSLTPSVSFTTSGRYLPRDAWSRLPVQHRNVDEVTVSIRHVPDKNLLFWLTADDEKATERVADEVARETFAVDSPDDERATTWVDVKSMLPEVDRGVYEITVEGGGAKASARLLMTDLNLVAKAGGLEGEDRLHVWALGMHDGANQAGVEITAVRPSGKPLATCTTTATGCTFTLPDDIEGQPVALVARRGSDLTYLKFGDLETDVSEAKVQGEAYDAEQSYRASLWTERGVFRPGETAHVAGVVRDEAHVAPPKDMPIDVQITDPRGKLIRTMATKANDAGVFSVDVPFPDYARTGSYTVTARAGSTRLGSVQFAVEEFVPERMEVEATVDGDGFLANEEIEIDAKARYLFGGSAADHRYEVACRLVPTRFTPPRNAGYSYGEASLGRTLELGRVTGTLGDEGAGSLNCPTLDHAGGFTGSAQLVADVAVFEAGSGRTTNDTAKVPVHAAKYYVGLRAAADKAEAGKPLLVEGVIVDWKGELVTDVDSVDLELQKLESEWGYVFDEDRGDERWQRILRPSPAGSETVKVSKGAFKVNLQPQQDGERFRVVARTKEARTAIEVEGTQRYWWWNDGEQSKDATPRPLKPSEVALTTPEKIEVGEQAKVSFIAPFKGRALVTLETDEVLRSEWLPVDAGAHEWDFTLGEFAENVYVSVLVVKDPHLESKAAFLPERAFGVQSIDVTPTAFVGKLDLSVPTEVRSDSKLDVDVDLGPGKGPRYVTVAAVDEGILSLTNFESPDPTDDLFPTRALGVKTFETVGWSMHLQPPGPSSTTGGDAEGGGAPGRVQMVKPVSLWSGVVEVPESGKTTVSFEVPRYRGKLRIMAVSAGTQRVAHADASVVVRDPVVVQTTLPRFLTEGDEAEIPVFLTNVSGKKRTVQLKLDAQAIEVWGAEPLLAGEEPLTFTGGKSTSVVLEDGESHTAVFRVRTNLAAGGINLSVVAQSDDVVVSESLDVPIESSGPRERRTQTVRLAGGGLDLNPMLTGWVAGTEQTNVWITNNPYGQAFSHLKHVIRYPYGCIEQTTSSTRPLLYVGNLLEASDPELVQQGKIEDMVQSGVDRLMNMQTPSGGFAYWMGGSEPTAWGTAYATHLLLDAKEAGFAVPEDNLQDAIDWLDRIVESDENATDPYAHGASPGGAAYMHYVLARAGKGHNKRMAQLLGQTSGRSDGPSMEATYLLQAGLYLAGDRRHEKALRNPDLSPLSERRVNDWTYYSDLRRRGFQLAVYADLFGDDGDAATAQGRLVAQGLQQKTSRYYNTQEIAWGMTGLGKIIQKGARDYDVRLTRNGTVTKPDTWGSGGKASELTWSIYRASEAGDLDIKVEKAGGGELYAVINSEGVRTDGQWRFGGNRLAVQRTYLDQDGDTINLDAVELGDVVYAKVTLRNTSNSRIQNIALVDRFPAAWEIENPRLGRGGSADWVDTDALWKSENMNIRDDRLEVFGALNPNESVDVVYTMRAVTSGSFTLPPVEAEAMYNPDIWTRAPGGTVRVFGAWDGFYL